MHRSILNILILAALGLGAGAALTPAAAQEYPVLLPGKPVKGVVGTTDDSPLGTYSTYTFEVTDDVIAVEVIVQAEADVDLFVGPEEMMSYDEDATAYSTEDTGHERLRILRQGYPGLENGTYYLDVTYLRGEPWLKNGEPQTKALFTIELNVHRARVDGQLTAGKVVEGTIDPGQGPYRSYLLNVPPGTTALRVDLFDCKSDLDLRVRHGLPMRTNDEADIRSESLVGTEVIILPQEGRLKGGTYYVDVVEPVWLEWPTSYRLLLTLDREAPAVLTRLPDIPEPTTPLDRAVLGTVEILHEDGGGSGALISPAGHLITNYHVVQTLVEGGVADATPLIVAMTLDHRSVAQEVFLARILEVDEEQDLALLQCVSGLYGQPIPGNFQFPTVPLGDPSVLRLADPLIAIGFPEVGGLGTRVSVTLTRGILAGFERRGDHLHIKTDALINLGNSGGPVFNGSYRVIGIATETISDDAGNGKIGVVRPLWLVPESWWGIAGVER